MATVVSVSAIADKLGQLKWQASATELVEKCRENGIPATELAAYLDAAIANPTGFNDANVTGVSAGNATKMTTYFRGLGAVAV